MKTILITGCSSGIGYYCAKQLQKRGYQVIASCRNVDDVRALNEQGITCVQLDYTDTDSIEQGLADALAFSGGKLDALFNNGAYGQPGAVEDLPVAALRRQFETNVFGWHHLTQLVCQKMRQQGHGRIIQNSSVLGLVTLPYRGAYNASKFALEGLTDTLRLELQGSGVYISLIEPGPISSRFRDNALHAFLTSGIDIEKSAHRDNYLAQQRRLESTSGPQPFTLGPEAVYKRLVHALESQRPQARYYVTTPTYLFGFLKRILPSSWLDWVLTKSR
ncbi:SDR family oxidoreductase [Pseudoalteromonas sp. MM17-2]|uniref:SDR family oxidoreductase n=1 Tax=Pseudoalteromonas sp. MM17-2 TaxID=2917753 RepID=UPI001EF5910E|nr:SDR family oxidoreductase [Pseudoalteromonas sp. MM17-2]MCG7542587.1 SDR family oxidoreductase [Pseudoalteromonas sp. MM17-2]